MQRFLLVGQVPVREILFFFKIVRQSILNHEMRTVLDSLPIEHRLFLCDIHRPKLAHRNFFRENISEQMPVDAQQRGRGE